MHIESYRSRLEEFARRLNHELYLSYSGKKDGLEIVRLYSDYSDFFCIESIREIEAALKTETFQSRRKSLEKMQLFLMAQYLDYRTAPVSEEIARLHTEQSFVWEGREICTSEVHARLRREPDALIRRKLYERKVKAEGDSEELKRRKIEQLHASAIDLGFENYVTARERIDGIRYERLLSEFEEILSRMEDKFLERFRWSLETTVGVPFQEAGSWDIPYWEEKNDKPDVFRRQDLPGIVELAIEGLGLRPENPEAIFMDLDQRNAKRSAPLCIPIRVPQEIKIIMMPEDGVRHYAALFHECGHALHFAWTSPSLYAEHRILGDRGLSEGYAFLFEHFTQEPDWLERMIRFTNSDALLRFRALFHIFLIRCCTGRLRFAVELHGGQSLNDAPRQYSDIMKTFTGLQHSPELWTGGLEDGFIYADHLRGWAFEAMLSEYLRTKYGNAWSVSRAASGFLKEIWETGMLYSAEELCREIGIGDLEPQILADQLWEGLQH